MQVKAKKAKGNLPEGAYKAKKNVCPKMTQNMLIVRIPLRDEIADDGTFVFKICAAFFFNEKHTNISSKKLPVESN